MTNSDNIYDLWERIQLLKSEKARDRMIEACNTFPKVGVVGLNGIPFVGTPPTYFGVEVNADVICQQINLGLGFGGVLTFMNRGEHNLYHLAEISIKHGHDWACRNITVTLCFAGCPTFVEMSFARDRRFHLSWVESKGAEDWSLSRIFTATGSLKDWKKYLSNRNSNDFSQTQKHWLNEAYLIIANLFPDYFND